MEVTLTDEWKIVKTGHGYALRYTSEELFKRVHPKTKETLMKPKEEEYFYGTFYQALCGFVKKYPENGKDLGEVLRRAEVAKEIIDESCKNVEKEYKIVKVVRG